MKLYLHFRPCFDFSINQDLLISFQGLELLRIFKQPPSKITMILAILFTSDSGALF